MGKSRKHRSRSHDRSGSRSRRSSHARGRDLEQRLDRLESLILRLSQPNALGAQAPQTRVSVTRDSSSRSRSPVHRDNPNLNLSSKRQMRASPHRARNVSDVESRNRRDDRSCEHLPEPSRATSPLVEGQETLLLQDETDLDKDLDQTLGESDGGSGQQISEDFLNAIGFCASQNIKSSVEIPSNMLNNLLEIMFAGLDKTLRDKVLASYVPAEAAVSLGFRAPSLNEEIAAVLNAAVKSKDLRLQTVQQRLLSTMAAQTAALQAAARLPNSLQQERSILGTFLADIGKISADTFNLLSTVRREALFPYLSKTVKEASSKAPAKNTLFGESIMDDLKKQKSLESLSRDLKATSSSSWTTGRRKQQTTTAYRNGPSQSQPSTSQTASSSLNSRGPYRQKMGTRSAGQNKYSSQKTRR